jgi:hypothetical protein
MLIPRFHIKPEVCPLDAFRGMLAGGATAPWAGLPGLRNKYFTLYGEENMGAGFYTWTSKAALDEYLKSELWAGMAQQPHLDNLTFKVCEILEGGECCTDLGCWPDAVDAYQLPAPGKHNEMRPILVCSNRWVKEENKSKYEEVHNAAANYITGELHGCKMLTQHWDKTDKTMNWDLQWF